MRENRSGGASGTLLFSVPVRRVLALGLSAVFLAGSAAEVYGLHDCPHHHGDPVTPSVLAGESPAADAPRGAPVGPESDSACTCVGTCHGGAAAPTTALDRGTPQISVGETLQVALGAPPAPRPARDATVLLPYPTGPPASRRLIVS